MPVQSSDMDSQDVMQRPLDDAPHRLWRVPVIALMPHSRCNCRCIMCDIWKANRTGTSLSANTLARLSTDLRALEVQEILLSGGEALMHPNLWALCAIVKALPARITLLSTGLLLARHAEAVTQWCDEVIVSLDGPPAVHNAIRGIANAFDGLAKGVAALRKAQPGFAVSARCVLQKLNFRHLPQIIETAHALGLDRISFLNADTSSSAFNRPGGWGQDHIDAVCPDEPESAELCERIEEFIAGHGADFASRFIAETPDRLRRLGQYYCAVHGKCEFPEVRCRAPWVSTVIETDGTVRPCFFHDALGNIHENDLYAILNSEKAVAFRGALDVRSDPICKRCVCTFNP
jgi:Fe-coproporphyrin III synthase